MSSPPFRNSRRYPAFLGFVVEKAVVGAVDDLKERTLGVEVFQRPPDYDTSADPIVRFTAGEVRKRIAQYYSDDASHGPVEINLPVGSYVPRFYRRIAADKRPAPDVPVSSQTIFANHEFEAAEGVGIPTIRPLPRPVRHDRVAPDHPIRAARFLMPGRVFWLCAGLCALLLGIFALYRVHVAEKPIMEVWAPVLRNADVVLISAGRPHSEENETGDAAQTTIREHFLRPEFRVSLTTVAAISRIAGFLESQHKRFQIHEAYSNNLQDLHGRSVVLVNGNDNKWTVLLLRSLRFQFVQNGDFAYILDTQHPEKRDWHVDFSTPYLQQTVDYGIVARFYDATTGGPVVVVAGISSNGTDAGGDFIVSPEALEALARSAPHRSLNQNFEAVIRVEVIGGSTGATTVVASHFW